MGACARVLGVDACRAGWVGVVLDGGHVGAYVAGTLDEVIESAGRVEVVGVDMPIGLPDAGRRQADVLARKAIGPLWASVFMTPARMALEAADHATASARNRSLTGAGVSIQAFSLRRKLFEVDSWVRHASCRVVEVHPQVSFARLAGVPLTVRKRTREGAWLRRALLASAGIVLPEVVSGAAVDDVLDAGVVAWTARRVCLGEAISLPDPPEVFSDGLPAAIWV